MTVVVAGAIVCNKFLFSPRVYEGELVANLSSSLVLIDLVLIAI